MSGARHRRKGNRVERELVAYLRDRGLLLSAFRSRARPAVPSSVTISAASQPFRTRATLMSRTWMFPQDRLRVTGR